MPSKRYGIRMKDKAEPDTPHLFPGLRGYYRPGKPTPVGSPGDVIKDLDDAKEAVEQRKDALELVELSPSEAKDAEAQSKSDLNDGRKAVADARRDGRAEETPARFKDEQDAVKE